MRPAALALALALAAGPAAAVGPGPQAAVDLVAVTMVMLPADAAPGDAVRFVATVTNTGDADAGAFSVQFCIVDMGWIVFTAVGGLAAGGTVLVESEPWSAVGTSNQAQVFVDIDNQIPEASETNNEFDLPFTLQPGPDLVVAAIATDPAAPVQGSATALQAEVRNAGPRDAGPFHVAFYVDGDYLGAVAVDGLAGGAARVVQSPLWAATSGPHAALVDADADQEVGESDEGNNAGDIAFSVAETPPLAVALDGDAQGGLAVALDGTATGIVAFSALGDSEANRLALSATGDATAPGAVAASGAGDSRGAVAVSALGRAEGSTLGLSACGLASSCGA